MPDCWLSRSQGIAPVFFLRFKTKEDKLQEQEGRPPSLQAGRSITNPPLEWCFELSSSFVGGGPKQIIEIFSLSFGRVAVPFPLLIPLMVGVGQRAYGTVLLDNAPRLCRCTTNLSPLSPTRTLVPASAALRIDSHHFRVLLLRRFRLPLRPVSRTCRCGGFLDPFGHHRAACSRAGVLAGGVTRICREAGARVSTNVFVRDLDLLAPNVQDARRLEIVVEGLPLHGGEQLAVDTTLVSAHHCDGTVRHGAAHIDGAALVVARRRTERACPSWWGWLAGEVGGRWSGETVTFLRLLAAALAQRESAFLRRRACWWGGMLACAAARAFAASLLEQRSNVGGDANPPLISSATLVWWFFEFGMSSLFFHFNKRRSTRAFSHQ